MATKPSSYPAATGRAAQTVAEHAAKEDLVFWGAWVWFPPPGKNCLRETEKQKLIGVVYEQFCPFTHVRTGKYVLSKGKENV